MANSRPRAASRMKSPISVLELQRTQIFSESSLCDASWPRPEYAATCGLDGEFSFFLACSLVVSSARKKTLGIFSRPSSRTGGSSACFMRSTYDSGCCGWTSSARGWISSLDEMARPYSLLLLSLSFSTLIGSGRISLSSLVGVVRSFPGTRGGDQVSTLGSIPTDLPPVAGPLLSYSHSPLVLGSVFSPSSVTGGLSAPSRCHGRLTWCWRTLTCCSCSSKPFWFSSFAFSSYSFLVLSGELLNVLQCSVVAALRSPHGVFGAARKLRARAAAGALPICDGSL